MVKICFISDTETDKWSMPVEVPEKFEFPFEPYDIQQGFMRQLYTCLEQGRIGIFESPTGTVSIRMQPTGIHRDKFPFQLGFYSFYPIKT